MERLASLHMLHKLLQKCPLLIYPFYSISRPAKALAAEHVVWIVIPISTLADCVSQVEHRVFNEGLSVLPKWVIPCESELQVGELCFYKWIVRCQTACLVEEILC